MVLVLRVLGRNVICYVAVYFKYDGYLLAKTADRFPSGNHLGCKMEQLKFTPAKELAFCAYMLAQFKTNEINAKKGHFGNLNHHFYLGA